VALAALEWAGPPWAVLEVPETVPGRELEKRLQNAGVACISVFSVPVLLNDFDRIREIPLDRYDDYVEVFDPRNDGYAARLRSFFIAEGKCRFFLQPDFNLRRKLVKLLPELSGAWVLESSEIFPVAACVAFIVAALVFVLREAGPGKRGFGRSLAHRFSGEPGFLFGAICTGLVLFPLALAGVSGLVASGLFVLLFHSTKPVVREYFRHYRKNFRSMTGNERREFRGCELQRKIYRNMTAAVQRSGVAWKCA
jgi:hypothetical protein